MMCARRYMLLVNLARPGQSLVSYRSLALHSSCGHMELDIYFMLSSGQHLMRQMKNWPFVVNKTTYANRSRAILVAHCLAVVSFDILYNKRHQDQSHRIILFV